MRKDLVRRIHGRQEGKQGSGGLLVRVLELGQPKSIGSCCCPTLCLAA